MSFRLFALLTLSLVHEPDGSWRLPRNELGEECPNPIEPLLLAGAPMGQYHCNYCGGMQLAGTPHMDWRPEDFMEIPEDALHGESGEVSW